MVVICDYFIGGANPVCRILPSGRILSPGIHRHLQKIKCPIRIGGKELTHPDCTIGNILQKLFIPTDAMTQLAVEISVRWLTYRNRNMYLLSVMSTLECASALLELVFQP